MCLSWHLFTHAGADYFPKTHPQRIHTCTHTNTYTHTHLDSREKEVWIMLALRDGQANKTHLETIESRARIEESFSVGGGGARGEEGQGWRITALRGAVQLQSVVAMPIYTPTQTNPRHSSPSRARLISCQSLWPADPRGAEKRRDGWGDGSQVAAINNLTALASVCDGILIRCVYSTKVGEQGLTHTVNSSMLVF